ADSGFTMLANLGRGGPSVTVLLGPGAGAGFLACVGLVGLALLLPTRRRLAGVRVGAGQGVVLAFALTMRTFPWPLALGPRDAAADCNGPSSTVYYYHYDHLGSTQAVSTNTGALAYQYRYSVYGEVWGRFDGAGANVAPSANNRYEFT